MRTRTTAEERAYWGSEWKQGKAAMVGMTDHEQKENDFSMNLLADFEELLAERSWKPIETADNSQHGNEILCAHGYDGDTGGPCSVDRAWWDANHKAWRYHYGLIADPQFWMPLPPPPSEIEGGEASERIRPSQGS